MSSNLWNARGVLSETMTTIIDGNAVAEEIRDELADTVNALDEIDVKPGSVIMLISDDPASETHVSVRQRDCEEIDIEALDYELDPGIPIDKLYPLVDNLNGDSEAHGIPVQTPVPDHVDNRTVLRRTDPARDVDGFYPENMGHLVVGDARSKPCASRGVQKLLAAVDMETEGTDMAVIGRSDVVGKLMANLPIQEAEGGNAMTTVCHSRIDDFATKTRETDIVIVTVGVSRLATDNMLFEGAVVIDVGVNCVDTGDEEGYEFVGDVEFDSAKEEASTITLVSGGIGPMTRAMPLQNVAKATVEAKGIDVGLL